MIILWTSVGALCRNVSTELVDIYEVKRYQLHLLAAIQNNWLEAPLLDYPLHVDYEGKRRMFIKPCETKTIPSVHVTK